MRGPNWPPFSQVLSKLEEEIFRINYEKQARQKEQANQLAKSTQGIENNNYRGRPG